MSQENVEVVRRGYAALRRHDLAAVLDLFTPDVEATSRLMDAEGIYRGRAGMRRFFEDILSVFPDWRPEVLQVRDHGDIVIVQVRIAGRAVESGITMQDTAWQALRFRDGKIAWVRGYRTEEEALEAVGPRE